MDESRDGVVTSCVRSTMRPACDLIFTVPLCEDSYGKLVNLWKINSMTLSTSEAGRGGWWGSTLESFFVHPIILKNQQCDRFVSSQAIDPLLPVFSTQWNGTRSVSWTYHYLIRRRLHPLISQKGTSLFSISLKHSADLHCAFLCVYYGHFQRPYRRWIKQIRDDYLMLGHHIRSRENSLFPRREKHLRSPPKEKSLEIRSRHKSYIANCPC